ncbi:MAG: dienelactone hydrolase [Bacteroidota bacterium]
MKEIHHITLNSKHNNRPFLVDVRYNPTNQTKPIILFIHGFKGFKDWGHFNLVADFFMRSGFVYAKLNTSLNGTTPEHTTDFVDLEAFGQNNFSIELDDIEVTIDHLFSEASPVPPGEIDLQKLYLIGHSRGGGLALMKAAEDKRVKKVASWAAINDLEKRWPEEALSAWQKEGVQYIYNARTDQQMPLYYQIVEDFHEHRDRLDIPNIVKRLDQPLLFLHGTADETLPYRMAEEMKAWNPESELMLIDNGSHTFGGAHPWEGDEIPHHSQLAIDRTLAFFNK